MMVDLAEFKYFNDIYGHIKGDEILRTFARKISGVVRNCDVVGRFGGDEFLLILPGARLKFMENVMYRIKEACRNIHISGIPDGIIRPDIGVCTCPDETTDLMEAVHRADRRMYDLKGARKNVISEDSFEV
jgi:diguanylate cyclase (GGDEF)-like protein